MPIKIVDSDSRNEIAWLAGDYWDLPNQLDILEKWLQENRESVSPGDLYADIGFDIRPEAAGGGGTLSPESMRIMADLGIELYFSEYPGTIKRQEENNKSDE